MSTNSVNVDHSNSAPSAHKTDETWFDPLCDDPLPELQIATMAPSLPPAIPSSQNLGGNSLWKDWTLADPDKREELIHETATLARLYGRTTDDFANCDPITIGPISLNVYSNHPLTTEQEEALTQLIKTLPLDLARSLSSPIFQESGETFSIAIVSAEEFAQIESDPLTASKYQFNTKILYLPEAILEDDWSSNPKEAQHSVTHEFCHALLDTLTADTLTSRLASKVFTWYESALETSAEYFCEPENQDECLVGLGLSGTLPVGIAGYLAVKSAPLPSLGLALAGLAAYGVDEYVHFDMHSEGLIAHEYDLLKERVPDENSYLEYTVSAYAGEAVGEFAAETLMAYFQNWENRFAQGEYYGDSLYGHKTQDLLIDRHPALYLAYETLFAEDSPVRGSTVIFTDPFYPLVYDVIENNENNIYAARTELFETLGAIKEIAIS